MNRQKGSKPKTLRKDNTSGVLELFKSSDILSASDILSKINLSKPTIMKILDSLEQNNYIINRGKGDSSGEGGRKPMLYRLNAQRSYSIAFHIFPNELYGVITDLKSKILKTISRNIDSGISFNETISLISECSRILVQDITEINSLTGIAIGSHGATDHKRGVTIHAPHFHNWGKNADFRTALQKELETEIDIFVDNQIRYQILSEKVSGKNRNSQNLIVIEAGVGLVAGIMSRNRIKRGTHYLAGEIGHMIINPGGEECACGGRGCFEAMVTSDRIKKKAVSDFKKSEDSLIFSNTGPENLHIFDIFSASNNGDPLAMELMDDLAYWFAIGLTNLQLSYDPESIIIQGVYSQAGDYFLKSMKRQIKEISPLLRDAELDIRLSLLGKERSVIGATWLLAEEYYKKELLIKAL